MLMIRIVLVGSLAMLAALLFGATGASAHAPHPGLSFAIGINVDGDGDNDCGTGVPMSVGNGAPDPVSTQVTDTMCEIREDASFRVNAYLMANGGLAADGLTEHLTFTGMTPADRGDSVWEGCEFEATAFDVGFENTACATGLPPAVPLTGVGLASTFTFTCTGDGSIALDSIETVLTDGKLEEHGDAGPDVLTIDCQEGLPELNGDSDCNGSVNSIDAALILQNVAGLLANIPCPGGADADDNGNVNAIDAALVLQVSAGLLDEL